MSNKESEDRCREERPPSIMERLDQAAEDTWAFAQENRLDAAAYCLMVLGVLISIINPTIGGSIVGAITGIYFGDFAVHKLQNIHQIIADEGLFSILILGGAGLALAFSLPFFFIGGSVVIAIKAIAQGKSNNNS